ncbi:unnamed protein product [Periconia digitata]|uniref:Uncharacterized protein n=1 Tax=Periconia digitata TaxID=1303443 RepID=A0A9W4UM00_9PLEO|nr:unnamed protein product [Periconia digitata]
MPRPRKAKVASTTARVAKPSQPADPTPPKKQLSKSSQKASAVGAQPLDEFSDDSDGLVVRATRSRSRMPWQFEPQKDVDFTMTGALLAEDVQTDALGGSNHTPQSKTPKRTRRSLNSAQVSSVTKTPASETRQGRSTRASARGTPTEDVDSSGFGDQLLSFTSLGSDSPAHGTRPPSAIKVGATPAHEQSVLALANFKRRPRQHSLLRSVQPTTDVEDNDLDDFDFDSFLPEAESTPLHVHKAAPGEITGNDSGVNLSSSGSRGKKRKLSPVVQVPRSSPPYDAGAADVESPPLSSPGLPEVIHSAEEMQRAQGGEEPDPYSETMAPPMSSSDYEHDVIDVPRPTRRAARTTRATSTRVTGDIDSEEEAEEEATRSLKQTRGKQKTKNGSGISTAKLQSLLPRRRTQIRKEVDEYDIPEDSDSDLDELALPERRSTAASKPVGQRTKKKTRAAKKPTAKAQKNPRTYGRRQSSDKENQEEREEEVDDGSDAEDTIEVATTTKPSNHLELMAKKFEEVDEFELDFESVSYVQTSSPSR